MVCALCLHAYATKFIGATRKDSLPFIQSKTLFYANRKSHRGNRFLRS